MIRLSPSKERVYGQNGRFFHHHPVIFAGCTTIPATPTPHRNATPRPGFSPPILSSQGQLAFVQDEVLYVETAEIYPIRVTQE